MSPRNRWRWILLGSLVLLGSIVGIQLAFFRKSQDVIPQEELGPPLYQDMTADSGVKFSYRNGFLGGEYTKHFAILDSLGGGLGLIDFYGNLRPEKERGLLDIFVAGGGYYDFPGGILSAAPVLAAFDTEVVPTTDISTQPKTVFASSLVRRIIKGYPCKLYKNLGNFKFKDV